MKVTNKQTKLQDFYSFAKILVASFLWMKISKPFEGKNNQKQEWCWKGLILIINEGYKQFERLFATFKTATQSYTKKENKYNC